MKMKSIKKLLTFVLSASMLMGGAMPVLAAEDGVDVDAPIYSLDIMSVIVPTSYAVAFNPEGLQVKNGDSTTTDQILSKNYGIINKSSKDKLITVTLKVTDQNTGSGITFVSSAQDVTDAEDGEYKVHLTAIPADATNVQVISGSNVSGGDADQTTTADALNDVIMTQATGNAVTLRGGENYLGFKLEKAKWTPKAGSELTLGTTNSNNVADNFEVTGLADGGKGITAFTFGGEMNVKADWSKLTEGVKITVIYGNENAASDLTAISGTGAMVALNIAPTFTAGKGIGEIKYTPGAGNDGLKAVKKIELLIGGKIYDAYNAFGANWPAATDRDGVITLSPNCLKNLTSGDTFEVMVTYETNGGATKTSNLHVARVVLDEDPTFTTGNGIGQINYTVGMGNDGLKEIQKIEVVVNGDTHDPYHAYQSLWPDATDEDGVITLHSNFMKYITTGATFEAKVIYVTNGGETRTFTVDVKRQ